MTKRRSLSSRQMLILTGPFASSEPPSEAAKDASVVRARRFITTDMAAEYLCMSPRTLEKYRVVGGGPPFRRFGRRVVYSIEDLDRWADGQVYRSTSDPGESTSDAETATPRGRTPDRR